MFPFVLVCKYTAFFIVATVFISCPQLPLPLIAAYYVDRVDSESRTYILFDAFNLCETIIKKDHINDPQLLSAALCYSLGLSFLWTLSSHLSTPITIH